MQKKLLGIAVAAALAAPGFALAQSSVQIYGTVQLSFNATRFGNDALGNPSQNKFAVNSHSSNWGLRATESLGGGMTAWFQSEFNLFFERTNANTAGIMSHRNSGLGLRGAFGNIYAGQWESPWTQTFRLWDVGTIGGWGPVTSIIGRRETSNSGRTYNCGDFGAGSTAAIPATICTNASQGGPAFGSAVAPGTVSSNLGYPLWRRMGASIFYESPIWSGVQLKVAIQPNENKSSFAFPAGTAGVPAGTAGVTANPSMWSGSLTWTGFGGRARAFIANMRAKDWSQVGATDSGYTFGGGYDFGPANVGATYEKYTYKIVAGDVNAKEWAVGLAVPIGPGHIGANFAKAKQLDGAGAPFLNDTSAKMWNLGYQWDLSKRTALGFGAARITNGQNAAFTWTGSTVNPQGTLSGVINPGTSQTNVFVALRHSF